MKAPFFGIALFLSSICAAQEPQRVAISDDVLKALQGGGGIGAFVTGWAAGGFGRSEAGSGVAGDTLTGVGGNFTTWGSGTAVGAYAPYGGTALSVEGSIKIQRTPGNILKLYDPDTGELVGVFEFSAE